MSADNWTMCPKCKKDSDLKKIDDYNRVKKLYGKVSKKEYDAALKEYTEKEVRFPNDTLAEYTESYMLTSKNKFCVSYSCHCSICGFEYSFKHVKSTDEIVEEFENPEKADKEYCSLIKNPK